MKRPILDLRTRWGVGVSVVLFEIGTIVSYRGRRHVVVGITPMSVTPPLVELDDPESRRTRRVRVDDPELVVEATKAFQPDDDMALAESGLG